MIVLGDGGYRGMGYVMVHHAAVQLVSLQDLPPHTDLHIFNSWEGIQLEQLMSHYITRTMVTTVAKYDLYNEICFFSKIQKHIYPFLMHSTTDICIKYSFSLEFFQL